LHSEVAPKSRAACFPAGKERQGHYSHHNVLPADYGIGKDSIPCLLEQLQDHGMHCSLGGQKDITPDLSKIVILDIRCFLSY
jgi:hypothetical protein